MASLLVATSLMACNSEEVVQEPIVETPEEDVLTIMVPQYLNFEVNMGTREDDKITVDATQTEATVDNLWFFAFPAETNTGVEKFVQEISGNKVSQEESDDSAPNSNYTGYTGYAGYKVKGIRKGKYRIYVVANLEKYNPTDNSNNSSIQFGTNMTESQLQNLILNFGTGYSTQITERTIPMACYYNEILYKTSSSATDYTKVTDSSPFNFQGTGEILYVDMTMLCSKVRYTILFDRESFSQKFRDDDIVDFNSTVNISNICLTTAMAPNTNTSPTLGSGPYNAGTLGRKYYPEDAEYGGNGNTDLYLDITKPSNTVAPADLIGCSSWTNEKQRAWQGIVYLPENKATTTSSQTTFKFHPTTGSNVEDNKQFSLTLNRGNFYDVVAKLESPKEFDFYISVNIQVLAWAKRDISVGW